MRASRRIILGLIFILILLPVTGAADLFEDSEQILINPNINKMITITQCGEILLTTTAIFEGTEASQGHILVIPRDPKMTSQENRSYMRRWMVLVDEIFKPMSIVIRVEDLLGDQCT